MSTILITGASSGLGAEMARQFAALGHDLALCARRTERLDELMAEIAAFEEVGLDLAIVYLPPPLSPAVLEPLAQPITTSGQHGKDHS